MNSSPQDSEEPKWTWCFLDSRSLSLFRWMLAITVLLTGLAILPDVKKFYGPQGIIPSATIWSGFSLVQWPFTLLFAFPDSAGAATTLIVLMVVCSIFMAVGCWVRVAAFVAWIAFGSLLARVPMLRHTGDTFLLIMLLFACFFPMSGHLKLGSRKSTSQPELIHGFISTLWLIQIAIVYGIAGTAKLTGNSWLNGEHMTLLYSSTEFVRPFGSWLAQFTLLNRFSTWISLIFELSLPLLILGIPCGWQRARMIIVVAGAIFHLMIALTLDVGEFPLISLTALASLLPPNFWNWLAKRRHRLDQAAAMPVLVSYRFVRARHATAFAVGFIFLWQGSAAAFSWVPSVPLPIRAVLYQLNVDQRWMVFVNAPQVHHRFGIEMVNPRGRVDLLEVDLIPSKFDTLPSESERFGGARWRFVLLQCITHKAYTGVTKRILRQFERDLPDEIKEKYQTIEFVVYSRDVAVDPPVNYQTVLSKIDIQKE